MVLKRGVQKTYKNHSMIVVREMNDRQLLAYYEYTVQYNAHHKVTGGQARSIGKQELLREEILSRMKN